MSGRMYSVEFSKVAVSADQDWFELTPADDKPIAIHAVYLSQSTDVGDAAEEILDFKISRGKTSSGSGGSSSTPAVLNPLDTAAGATCEVNNDTVADTGTIVDLHSGSFNIRTGLQLVFPPELRPITTEANTTITVTLLLDPADSLTMSGTVVFEELI